jgi:hypothetical protein
MHYLTEVMDRNHRGWLKIKDGPDTILLPYSTRVSIVNKNINSETIKIEESDRKGQVIKVPFLLKSTHGHYSFFSKKGIRFSRRIIHVKRKDNVFIMDGKRYAIEISDNCKDGTYFLKFPIRKFNTKGIYLDETKGGSRFADTWFPLVSRDTLDQSRFLHYGTYSEGCITVKHIINMGSVWSDIFSQVMLSRIDDIYLAEIDVK